MRLIGNILWIIFGGLLSALGWIAAGAMWCVTIVGIPIGLQCFKLASISFNPFGKEVISIMMSAISLGLLRGCSWHHNSVTCQNPAVLYAK